MIPTEDFSSKLNEILNNPDSMAQILSMAQALGASPPPSPEAPPPPAEAPPPPPMMPDPKLMQGILQLMQQVQHTDKRQEALLAALKPYLRPERRGKLDQALQLARVSHLAGFALRNYGDLPGK